MCKKDQTKACQADDNFSHYMIAQWIAQGAGVRADKTELGT
jgi:hypothetical protein